MEMFQLAGKWRLLAEHFISGELLPVGTIVGEGTSYPLLNQTKPSTMMEPADRPEKGKPGENKTPLFSAQQGAAQNAKLAAAQGDFKTVSAPARAHNPVEPQPVPDPKMAGPTPKPEQIPGGSVPPERAEFAHAGNKVEPDLTAKKPSAEPPPVIAQTNTPAPGMETPKEKDTKGTVVPEPKLK